MAEKTIIVSIWREGTDSGASVNATIDPMQYLEAVRREYRETFLPVAAFEGDTDALKRIMNWTGLPHRLSVPDAAALFHSAVMSDNAWPAVCYHLNKLGDRAIPLLIEWQRAVNSVLEVAA